MPPNAFIELHPCAEFGQGRDLQHFEIVQVEHAVVRILGEQSVEHRTRLDPVPGECIALLDLLGPLAARQRLGVEGDMTNQVEGGEVSAQLLDQDVQAQTFRCQFFDDRLLAISRPPALQEVIQAGESFSQRLPDKVS